MDGLTSRIALSPTPMRSATPGTEVLHEDIGLAGELLDHIDAAIGFQIDGDRALVAIVVQERGRQSVVAVARGAGVIAVRGFSTLMYVGALIGQKHGREQVRRSSTSDQ